MYYVGFVLLELGNAGFSIIYQIQLTEVILTLSEPLCQHSAVSASKQPVHASCAYRGILFSGRCTDNMTACLLK
jgi:hypothetical protein